MYSSATQPLPPASSPASAEHQDPFVLRPGEARSLLAGSNWQRFAVLGDSLAAGVGDETPGYFTLSWADRVAAELATPGYLNLGVRDQTASAVAENQLGEAIAWQPDLVAVIAGGNDLLVHDPDLARTERALETMYRDLRASGADVVAFTLMDPSTTFGIPELGRRIGALNSVVRHAAMRSGAIVAEFAGKAYAADRTIYSDDLLHLNMRGHAIVAGAMVETLGELIRSKQGAL